MAADTPSSYRNLIFYEIFVRNHSRGGDFAGVEADLPRIRNLGVDVVWLMPIHPIGRVKRTGCLGSPYSIRDYRAVNPEYGTDADFARLVDGVHRLGMKLMIDAVFHHTAHDSPLIEEHPDWYVRDSEGRIVSASKEWTDVARLRHPNPALSSYLVQTLLYWIHRGVDGFRCDFAAALPLNFWLDARRAVKETGEHAIWLAESVHATTVTSRRDAELVALSDSQLYEAFDVLYDYDLWPIWQAAVQGQVPVARYLEMLRFQDCAYPANYVKLRAVENHDQVRIMRLAPSRQQAIAWTAFQAFNKGAFLIYAGQESGSSHRPSLFDTDRMKLDDQFSELLSRLAQFKKSPILQCGRFELVAAQPAIQASWQGDGEGYFGIFNVEGTKQEIQVPLADGVYTDVLNDSTRSIRGGKTGVPESAAVLAYQGQYEFAPFVSPLFNYHVDDA